MGIALARGHARMSDTSGLRWRITVTPYQTHPIRVGSNASEGPEQPIPEEIDDGEIGIRMPVMEEMQLLLSSEPAESPQPTAGDVILRIEIDMGVERQGQCRAMGDEQ